MTRKDFELIAEAIAFVEKRYGGRGTNNVVMEIVEEIANAIEDEHPRFNRARFEMAALPILHEEKKQAFLAKAMGQAT